MEKIQYKLFNTEEISFNQTGYRECMYFSPTLERKVRCCSNENLCFTYNDGQMK